MTKTISEWTSREAVGVFNDLETLEAAIDELESHGFDRAEISLLASEHAVEEKLGTRYDLVEQMEDDPDAPRVAYVSRESLGDAEGGLVGGLFYVGAVAAAGAIVASGGTLAAAIAAALAAGGAGGVIGGVLAGLVGHQHAEYLQEQIERGGILMWVRTTDEEREKRAVEILDRHSAHDVHVHDLAVKASGAPSDEVWRALSNPATVFSAPEDVLARKDIPKATKIEILRCWEYDAREMEVAEEENMPNGEEGLLSRVLDALHALGAGPDLEHTPPTKQGGV